MVKRESGGKLEGNRVNGMIRMCGGVSSDELEAIERSRRIDEFIKGTDERLWPTKLLLLGSAGSGKTTIMKTMRITHGNGFNGKCIEMIRLAIYSNTVKSLAGILEAMPILKILFQDQIRETDATMVSNVAKQWHVREPFSEELLDAMLRLWADKGVQECFSRSNEYRLCDSARYFLDDLERLGEKNYLPTEQDILCLKDGMANQFEVHFCFKGLSVLFVEGMYRRRMRHLRDSDRGIVFCVAMNKYDEVQYEGESQTVMQESLRDFGIICDSTWWTDATIFIFFTKKDLLAEKIAKFPLTLCFPEYTGGQNCEEASVYIRAAFESKSKLPARTVRSYELCATDADTVRAVFSDMTDFILADNLRNSALYY